MKTRALHRLAALALLCAAQASCYRFHLKSGARRAQPVEVAIDSQFHGAVMGDLVEVTKPYDLNLLCPHGWSDIDRRVGAFDWLVNAVTPFWFYADDVTVLCADASAMPGPPLVVPGAPQPAPSPAEAPAPEPPKASVTPAPN